MKKIIVLSIFVFSAGSIFGYFFHINPDKQIIFGSKEFLGRGIGGQYSLNLFPGEQPSVSILGTIIGDGVGYKNNTRTIDCRKDRMECEVVSIDQIGPNQVGDLFPPTTYSITKWDMHEVVATSGDNIFECEKTTININLDAGTTEWVQEPINQSVPNCKDSDGKIYKWTIENPPYWQWEKNVKK